MIYTAFGLPVSKIISGNVKQNKVVLEAYGGPKHGFDQYERTVNELRADDGIKEIYDAVDNPSSYQPTTESVVDFFDQHCK